MSTAKKLIDESWNVAQRSPEHTTSVARLVREVMRIDRKFEGDVRERLLAEAKSTFHEQLRILDTATRTQETLAQLKASQRRVNAALERMAVEQQAAQGEAPPPCRTERLTLH